MNADFLDDVAQFRHDLRTQIGAVSGYAEMILDDAEGLTAELVEDLRSMVAAGRALLGVVERISAEGRGDQAERASLARATRHELVTTLSVIVDTARIIVRKTPRDMAWHTDLDRINSAALEAFNVIDRFEAGKKSHSSGRASQGYAEPIVHGLAEANILPPFLATSRVLVVDDTVVSLQLMRRQLELLGCKVSTASDGSAALSMLASGAFDLALLDLQMPDMSGDEILQRIRRHPKLKHLPVIMTSASNDFDAVVRCIQRGAEDFLPKPVNPVLLRARLCSALQRKHLLDVENDYRVRLQSEKQRVEQLLHAILPAQAVRELQASQRVQPRRHDRVAVLFCDICNFTAFSEKHQPEQILEYLQELYEHFEGICDRYGLEKIKTIGDSFMAVAGLENSVRSPVLRAIHCAQSMITLAPTLSAHWAVRAAINVGPVVSGVVGRAKFAYDIWGDTVNVAARIESQAKPGEVWLSQSVVDQIEDNFDTFPCGLIELKGKGSTPLYRMDGMIQNAIPDAEDYVAEACGAQEKEALS